MNDTEPVSPMAPPALVKAARTFDALRLRLSVSASTMSATPPGP
jgi:hypothetical protein